MNNDFGNFTISSSSKYSILLNRKEDRFTITMRERKSEYKTASNKKIKYWKTTEKLSATVTTPSYMNGQKVINLFRFRPNIGIKNITNIQRVFLSLENTPVFDTFREEYLSLLTRNELPYEIKPVKVINKEESIRFEDDTITSFVSLLARTCYPVLENTKKISIPIDTMFFTTIMRHRTIENLIQYLCFKNDELIEEIKNKYERKELSLLYLFILEIASHNVLSEEQILALVKQVPDASNFTKLPPHNNGIIVKGRRSEVWLKDYTNAKTWRAILKKMDQDKVFEMIETEIQYNADDAFAALFSKLPSKDTIEQVKVFSKEIRKSKETLTDFSDVSVNKYIRNIRVQNGETFEKNSEVEYSRFFSNSYTEILKIENFTEKNYPYLKIFLKDNNLFTWFISYDENLNMFCFYLSHKKLKLHSIVSPEADYSKDGKHYFKNENVLSLLEILNSYVESNFKKAKVEYSEQIEKEVWRFMQNSNITTYRNMLTVPKKLLTLLNAGLPSDEVLLGIRKRIPEDILMGCVSLPESYRKSIYEMY